MKPEFSLHIFEKYSNIKFHENPSGGNRVVPNSLFAILRSRLRSAYVSMPELDVSPETSYTASSY